MFAIETHELADDKPKAKKRVIGVRRTSTLQTEFIPRGKRDLIKDVILNL